MSIAHWIKANPYVIVNVQNSIARCGRFPSLEAAIKFANENYGGHIQIEGYSVYVSQIPLL